MKTLSILFLSITIAMFASCDLRNDTAKNDMQKYTSSPTPPIVAAPSATPIDPKDIVTVDTNQEGDTLSVNGDKLTKTAACTKFNDVKVNGNDNVVTVKDACKQVMVNGDGNKITADAAVEFVMNGTKNVVTYARFANGKAPRFVENQAGNAIEKVSADASGNKNTK